MFTGLQTSEEDINMASQIRMTPELMRTRAKSYETEAGKLDDIIETMVSLLGMLQSEWEGDASAAYAEKFAELKPGFIQASQLIRDIAKSLNTTASIVEQTDANIAAQFRA